MNHTIEDGTELGSAPQTTVRAAPWEPDGFWQYQPRAWQLADYCFRSLCGSQDRRPGAAYEPLDFRLLHPVYPAGSMRADFTLPLGS